MANHPKEEGLLWRKVVIYHTVYIYIECVALQVTVVGEAGSGKTTLIKQFCEGKVCKYKLN